MYLQYSSSSGLLHNVFIQSMEFKGFRLIILHSASHSSQTTTFLGSNVFFCFGPGSYVLTTKQWIGNYTPTAN